MALDFNQLVNQMSPDEVNRQLLQGQQPTNPTLSNFIPKLFEVRQPMYEGLLGAEQSNALARQSGTAGLLGAAAALVTGMGRQGARRSPLQNILGALAAGYGTAGQAYGAGIEQISNAQKLADARMKQEAFNAFAKRYPQYAELARIDPGKAVELVTQMEKQRPIAEAYQSAGILAPQPSAVSPEMAQYTVSAGRSEGGIAGTPATVTAMPEPMVDVNRPLAQGTVETAPIPNIDGTYGALPPTPPAVDPMEAGLLSQKQILLNANAKLARLGSKEANDEIKNNLEQIKTLDTQLQQINVGNFDFKALKDSIPEEYRPRVDLIENMAKKRMLTGNELRIAVSDVQTAAQNKTADIQEYNQAKREGFTGTFKDWVQFAGGARRTQLNVNTGELSKGTKGKLEEELLTTGNAASRLNQIKSTFRPEYLNIKFRGQQEWNTLKDKFTSLDPKDKAVLQGYSTYKQNSINNLNQTIKDLTGAAMGVQEAERIIAGAPNAGTGVFDGDSPSNFEAKLNNQIKQVQYALARKQYSLTKGLRWEAIPLEKMPEIVNQRGKEIEKTYNLDPDKPADKITVQRQLAAEFGISF
jgi:hypothetical protein